MPRKQSNSSPKKGMNRDKAGFDLSNVEYSFAMNTNFQSGHGTGQVNLQKEPSNIYCSGFREGYKVIGHKYHLNEDRTYFFLTNPQTGYSEIGYIDSFYNYEGLEQIEKECGCDIKVVLEEPLEGQIQEATCTYTTLITDECKLGESGKCLNFSIDNPIHESNIQIKDEAAGLTIYFTDNRNPQRYIRLDDLERYYLKEEACEEPTPACLQCDKMNIFPEYEPFCLNVETIAFGGNLRAGNIQVIGAYSDSTGNELSEYYSLTNRVPIHDKDNNILDQTNLDYITNQAIKVSISGVDERFQYFKVIVIYRSGLDQSEAYYEYGVYPTSTNSFSIADLSDKTKTSSYNINLVKPSYLRAKGLAQGNGYLFQYGLTTKRVQNFQQVVNLMGSSVKWQTVEAEESLYDKGAYVANFIAYMRDEVTPLSIRFLSKGGHKTANFPFIPRPPKASEIEVVGEPGYNKTDNEASILENAPKCSINSRNKRWQYYNTATILGQCENTGHGDVVVEKEEVKTCVVEGEKQGEPRIVDSLGTGGEPYVFEGTLPFDIVDYINDNQDFIIDQGSQEWQDVIEIIDNPSGYPYTCTPRFEDNCGEPELVKEEIFAISVGTVEEEVQEVDVMTYQRPDSPKDCNQYTNPLESDTTFKDTYLLPNDQVYKRNIPMNNTTCQSSNTLLKYTESPGNGSQVDSSLYHQYGGAINTMTSLQGTKTSSATSTDVFTNKVHNNAIWYKVEFYGEDKVVIELTNLTIKQTDNVCQQKARVTVFNSCSSSSDLSTYSRIIGDMTTVNDSDKVMVLDSTDFPSGVAYIAVDTPIKRNTEFELTIGGTGPEVTITMDNTPFTVTYNTSLTQTASDFVVAHGTILKDNHNIEVTSSGPTLLFRTEGEVYDNYSVSTAPGELTITEGEVKELYYLTTLCGCPNIYYRDLQRQTVTLVTDLLFGKKLTYQAVCTFTKTLVEGCDPLPHEYGLFSYWESERTYPCNPELYNSKELKIAPEDIPSAFRTEFEEYYVDSTVSGEYVLNNEADFQDKPIRHYKFPDSKVVPFMSEKGSGVGDYGNSHIYPIGFKIDNEIINAFLDIALKNGIITAGERADISRYEIFRGDRSTDMSIIAKGLLFDNYQYPDEGGKTVEYPNYPLNSLGKDQLNGGINHPHGNLRNNSFTFHSPDTHWYKPTLPRELSVEGYQFGGALNQFDIVKGHPEYIVLGKRAYNIATVIGSAEAALELAAQTGDWLVLGGTGSYSVFASTAFAIAATIIYVAAAMYRAGRYRYEWINNLRNLGNLEQFAYYGVSIGKYTTFLPNGVGDSLTRGVPAITYMKSGRWEITNEVTNAVTDVNNVDRESSVYINLGEYPIDYPTEYINHDNVDVNSGAASRARYGGVGRSGKISKRTASPYASLKQYLPEQYGDINDVKWLHTGYCSSLDEDNSCKPVFGGDTTISRFSIKRKLPFFTTDSVGLAPMTPFRYSDYFNIFPIQTVKRYYLNYLTTQDDGPSLMGVVFPTLKSEYEHLDYLTGESKMYLKPPSKFYLYYYGIPYFLTESVINCNFRYAKREAHENFYPNVGDVMEWTQEQNVPLRTPNTVFFNPTYHSKPFTYSYDTLPNTYSKKLYDKLNTMDNTMIYSRQDRDETSIDDPWLSYRPFDTLSFNKDFGKLVDVDSIESDKMLARFTNGMSLVLPQDKMAGKEDEATAIFGAGGIDSGGPTNFNKTDLGYAGTQHTEKVSCEFGHFWADVKRGRVFQLLPGATGLNDITAGMSEWFKENLPFKITSYVKGIPDNALDNNFKGLGITMGWDERLKRVFLTKKDYIPLQDTLYEEGIGFYTGDLANCPDGYTYNSETKMCERLEISPKQPNGTPLQVNRVGTSSHGFRKPAVYSQYNSNGTANVDTGSSTGYTYQEALGDWWTGNGVVSQRYVNKLSKWSNSFLLDTWYGGSALIELTETKTYYIALAADDFFRFSLDGNVILTSDATAMDPQHNRSFGSTFVLLHIYPLEIEAGCHTIKVEGNNDYGEGLFAAAIFDNTEAEILNSTSQSDLNIIFSTEEIDTLYEDGFTYDCPEGFESQGPGLCDECERTEQIPVESEVIELHDPTKFRECSFTISYSPLMESWTSYFSFKPNYYIEYNNYFQTGVNYSADTSEIGLWSHYPLESSYNVFYGKLYPWIIEFPIVTTGYLSTLEEVSYLMSIRKYYNRHDYADIFGKGFTKAYIYNDQNNSGQIRLVPQNKNDRRQKIMYPQHSNDSTSILFTEKHGEHTFNTFYNRIRNEESGLPVWKNDCNQVEKEIDHRLMDYSSRRKDRLRGDYFLIRLIEDADSRNKYIFRLEKDKRDIDAN